MLYSQCIRCIRDEGSGSADPFYNAKNMAGIDDALARLEADSGVEHELIETDDSEEHSEPNHKI